MKTFHKKAIYRTKVKSNIHVSMAEIMKLVKLFSHFQLLCVQQLAYYHLTC